MKWIFTLLFMACVLLACVGAYQFCLICYRKLTKETPKEIQNAEC